MEEGQREFVAALRSQGLSSGFSPGDLRFQSVYGLWPTSKLSDQDVWDAWSGLQSTLAGDAYGGKEAIKWGREAYNSRRLR